jgi:hypothetical protein
LRDDEVTCRVPKRFSEDREESTFPVSMFVCTGSGWILAVVLDTGAGLVMKGFRQNYPRRKGSEYNVDLGMLVRTKILL